MRSVTIHPSWQSDRYYMIGKNWIRLFLKTLHCEVGLTGIVAVSEVTGLRLSALQRTHSKECQPFNRMNTDVNVHGVFHLPSHSDCNKIFAWLFLTS
jgi:hypothetical protein